MSSAVRSMPQRPASSVRLALPPAVERQNGHEEEGIASAIDGASPSQRHSRRRLASAAAACETFQRGDGRHIWRASSDRVESGQLASSRNAFKAMRTATGEP
jgi:hypothetical protein